MVDNAGRNTFGETQTGIETGTQLRSNTTDLPEARLKQLGVTKPITITSEGAGLIMRLMKDTGKSAQGAFVELQQRVKASQIRATDDVARRDINSLVRRYFPDGLEGIEKGLNEAKVYEQALYDAGFLEDGDPNFKTLEDDINKLPKEGRNKRSREGKRLFGIKESGGLPTVVGRDREGKIVLDKERVRPYTYRLSTTALDALETVKLPSFAAQPLTQEIQAGERKRLAPERAEARAANLPAIIQETLSTGSGETVEPNRRDVSRRASGAIISRRDVNVFKEAMGKVMEAPSEEKTNLFKSIMQEARKIDPKVSMDSMQDVKDYLYFNGVLEADTKVSEKLGPSRISDADVPEYVKPSPKFYREGLKSLGTGNSNEPLVINKLSASPNPYVEPIKPKTLDDLIGKGDFTDADKNASPVGRRFSDLLKSGGRKAIKVLPFVAAADVLTSSDPVAAMVGSTTTARSALSEIKADREEKDAKRHQLAQESMEKVALRKKNRARKTVRNYVPPKDRSFMGQ